MQAPTTGPRFSPYPTPHFVTTCEWCGRTFTTTRHDALTCSKVCRQAKCRATIPPGPLLLPLPALRLAYADPPYPGKAHVYRGHPDYAGEVDIKALGSTLDSYDGWALSTSAHALPAVLSKLPVDPRLLRVGIWFRRARPHATTAVLNAWEAVIYSPARAGHAVGRAHQVADLLDGPVPRRRPTLPTAVIGMKPPAFCWWLFRLLGASRHDTLADLFPGSGMVSRCWALYSATPRRAAPAGADTKARRVLRAAVAGSARHPGPPS